MPNQKWVCVERCWRGLAGGGGSTPKAPARTGACTHSFAPRYGHVIRSKHVGDQLHLRLLRDGQVGHIGVQGSLFYRSPGLQEMIPPPNSFTTALDIPGGLGPWFGAEGHSENPSNPALAAMARTPLPQRARAGPVLEACGARNGLPRALSFHPPSQHFEAMVACPPPPPRRSCA